MPNASAAPAKKTQTATASSTTAPITAPKKSAAPAKVAKKKAAAKPAPKATKKSIAKPAKLPKPKAKAAPKPAAKPDSKPASVAATPQPAASNNGAGSSNSSTNSNGKQKLVRDSFTMPSNDFGLIHTLKERALTFRRPAKKSELLRAGLHALAALNDAKLKSVLDGLAPLKSGRPKKDD